MTPRTGVASGRRQVSTLYGKLCDALPFFRKLTRHVMYQLMARFLQHQDWTFMNYGYAYLGSRTQDGTGRLALQPEDETNRYCIQLYHHVVSAIDLTGCRVLEIGCGRGGGSHFIKRYHNPVEMTGMDFSKRAVAFCQRRHNLPGLRFTHGDAEALPFDDESFHAVVNVESSHCYRSIPQFLSEVTRVLRPGGHLLFADFRRNRTLAALRKEIAESGLQIVAHRDITQNVLAAMDADNARKLAQIRGEETPSWLVESMEEFAGAPDSRIYEEFTQYHATYVSYTLRKAAA
jgi:ubiquinone/menaquinone biosynthesis C-methylase UbiE